jgi:hypothetical protein
MATGEQSNTWGDTTNTNLGTLLEQAISGYVTQAITDGSGANTTITIPNGASGVARNLFIEMTGALTFATTNLIVPANKKLYFVYNNTTGGFPVQVKVSGLTGVAVPNGKKMILVSNGTDIVSAQDFTTALAVGGLTSGRVTYAGTAGLLQDSANLTFSGSVLALAGTLTATGGIDKLTTASGAVSVAAATAPSVGYVLTATSATVATWQAPVSTPAGSNTQVQFNNSGAFGASSALTWDGTSLAATKFSGALNGTVGATTASTGAFTTISGALTGTVGATSPTTGAFTTVNGNTITTGTGVLTLAAGKTLTASNTLTLAGTDSTTMTFPSASAAIGYLNIPQITKVADGAPTTGADLTYSGKHIYHTSTAGTFTIPANSSIAYPIGTALSFSNGNGAGALTIAITTDTMYLAGAGTTGSRTLAANGVATAMKVESTVWQISGVGLT